MRLNARFGPTIRCLAVPVAAFWCLSTQAAIAPDETILLYPSIARNAPGGWEVQWRGVVYESERRRVTSFMARQLFGLSGVRMTEDEEMVFADRMRLFLVDNERRKTVRVRLGDDSWAIGRSGANGRFGSSQILNSNLVQTAWFADPQHFNVPLLIEQSGGRTAQAEIHIIGDQGLSVVSDIDDTIKLSDVLNREALLKNTFCRPFVAVPGMAETYRTWAGENSVAFHYVSASPWQLYLPLSAFVRSSGFPAGTFHLREFRLKDRSALEMLVSPEKYKASVIEPLMRHFPRRYFVFVGDSGEKDPEVYGTLARKYPDQVRNIFIRDVTGEESSASRYGRAFRGVPTNRWRIFREAAEIKAEVKSESASSPNRD